GEMHSNICNLIKKWQEDVKKTVKATSNLFLAESDPLHSVNSFQKREEVTDYQKQNNSDFSKITLRGNVSLTGKTSSKTAESIKDITGNVVKIMKNSILIKFSHNPMKVFDAVAKCSLSNLFLNGVRYGITTKKNIYSHLYSKKSLHGMVRKLDTAQNVESIEVNYTMIFGWIGRKPSHENLHEYVKDTPRQNQTDANRSQANVSSAGSPVNSAKEKKINESYSKDPKPKKNVKLLLFKTQFIYLDIIYFHNVKDLGRYSNCC
ncbi:unnamed protein product, partial [Meganyctiphanes norvegica]